MYQTSERIISLRDTSFCGLHWVSHLYLRSVYVIINIGGNIIGETSQRDKVLKPGKVLIHIGLAYQPGLILPP